MQLLPQSPTQTDPIEREVDLLLQQEDIDSEYAKAQEKEALELHLKHQNAMKKEALTTLKNMPDDFILQTPKCPGERDLRKRIDGSIQ